MKKSLFPTRGLPAVHLRGHTLAAEGVEAVLSGTAICRLLPGAAIAAARGCGEYLSTDAARPSTCSALPSKGMMSVTSGFPLVRVPVLSQATTVSLSERSSTSPFLMRMPSSAPRPTPTVTAVGVASPRAQGQAITRTEMREVRAKSRVFPRTKYHRQKAERAMARTTGIK